jgi:HSP20 family protein
MTVVVKRPRTTTSTFDQLFDEFFRHDPSFNGGLVNKRPAVNVAETGEGFRIEMAVPGLQKTDFQIDLDKDVLSITASKEVATPEGVTYKRREFGAVDFKRSFHLPETIDAAGIEAKYENGILSVLLPKKEEAKPQPARQITVG